ncbi:MAG: GNAT family N-acetyltransferase [Lachnospiraceae bacterium]|nr:GNAT family N-acetyltransferase [Lachnospiraceae bacterium]
MMNQSDHETKYMLYEPRERIRDIVRVEALIQNSVEGEDFLLVAESDDRIVGYISAQKGGLNRIAHSSYIVVGILKNYCGKGIGTEFFKRLDTWAEEKRLHV